MQQSGPSADMLMFQSVLFWIVAWWLAELGQGQPMWVAVTVVCATMSMCFAIGSARHAIRRPSPFHSAIGRWLWAVRPRKWMIAWACIVGLVLIAGRPVILYNYGSGRCQYVDWWLTAYWRAPTTDGRYAGCRFLSTTKNWAPL